MTLKKAQQARAYKLASTFYLSSSHEDWDGDRIRAAILADSDIEDPVGTAHEDQSAVTVWEPIDRHLECRSLMECPRAALDEIISVLAGSLVRFAETESHAAVSDFVTAAFADKVAAASEHQS